MFRCARFQGRRPLVPALRILLLSAGVALCCASAWAQNAVQGPTEVPPRKPVPMQIMDGTTGRDGAAATPKSKFPNIDTAKNRKDYEMGTDAGADTIKLGRDEESGDSVMTHKPVKQVQEKSPFEDQPIQIRPIIVPPGSHGR